MGARRAGGRRSYPGDPELSANRLGRGGRYLPVARYRRLTSGAFPDAVPCALAQLAGTMRAQVALEVTALDHRVSALRSKAPISW